MSEAVRVRRLRTIDERELQGLNDVLIDCVEGGASVGFMLPMTAAKAAAFWTQVRQTVERDKRMLFVAEDAAGTVLGTVQVVIALAENQPHRGDVAKMLVHRRARRLGVGAALLQAAEKEARSAGTTLLVLDTATEEAARLYVRQGWQLCGTVPNYALMPDGPPCATTFYYKILP